MYLLSAFSSHFKWEPVGISGTPYNGPYGEPTPEMGTFLRLQVRDMKGWEFHLLKYMKREGRSVISVDKKRVQKGQQMHFVAVKTFWFVIYSPAF